MSWPNTVSLITGTVGDSLGSSGESADRIYVAVTPVFGEGVHRLLHAATGTVWDDRAVVTSGTPALFVQVPHVDQTGFVDGLGNEVTDWYYLVQVITRAGTGKSQWSYYWQPRVEDGDTVDLDTLGDGVLVTDPVLVYTPGRDAADAREAAAQALASAQAADESSSAAAGSAHSADLSAQAADLSEQNAATSVTDALAAQSGAEAAESNAEDQAAAAGTSADQAATSAGQAATSATAAQTARTGAETARTGAEAAQTGAQATADALAAQKGAANGIAPLDGSSKLPEANLPDRLSSTGLANLFARLSGVQAVVSANGALVAGAHNPVDASGGNRTVTLADAPSAGLMVAVSKKDASANTVAVSVAHLRDGGAGSITLVGQHEALLLTSKADGSWWPVGDHKTKAYFDGAYVGKVATATSGALGISPNPNNQIGPLADNYTVFGGEASFPQRIRNARLSQLRGYDNDVWDNSIAAVLDAFHSIVGGTGGHATINGGSLHAAFGPYPVIGGGTRNRVVAGKSGILGGDNNSAGANAVTTLTAAIVVGDTTVTVASTSGIAVGQACYVGHGTAGLDGGEGPFERAVVNGIAGSVVSLNTFQSVASTQLDGTSTATAFTAAHPNGSTVLFSDGGNTGAYVGAGNSCHALGQYSKVIGGLNSRANALHSTAWGLECIADGVASAAVGEYAWSRSFGEFVRACGQFATRGDAQASEMVVRATTTDGATAVNLSPSGSGGTMHQLLRGQFAGITAKIVGQSTDGAVRAVYLIETAAQFGATGNSAWVGTPTTRTAYEDPGIGGVSFSAGSSVGSINIKVTGKAATTMKWVADVTRTEVLV